jgi:hypothetical protein
MPWSIFRNNNSYARSSFLPCLVRWHSSSCSASIAAIMESASSHACICICRCIIHAHSAYSRSPGKKDPQSSAAPAELMACLPWTDAAAAATPCQTCLCHPHPASPSCSCILLSLQTCSPLWDEHGQPTICCHCIIASALSMPIPLCIAIILSSYCQRCIIASALSMPMPMPMSISISITVILSSSHDHSSSIIFHLILRCASSISSCQSSVQQNHVCTRGVIEFAGASSLPGVAIEQLREVKVGLLDLQPGGHRRNSKGLIESGWLLLLLLLLLPLTSKCPPATRGIVIHHHCSTIVLTKSLPSLTSLPFASPSFLKAPSSSTPPPLHCCQGSGHQPPLLLPPNILPAIPLHTNSPDPPFPHPMDSCTNDKRSSFLDINGR